MFEKISAGSISPNFKEVDETVLNEVLSNGQTRKEWAEDIIKMHLKKVISIYVSQCTKEYGKIYVPFPDEGYSEEEIENARQESFNIEHYPIALSVLKDVVNNM
jgi:hypothetical protein